MSSSRSSTAQSSWAQDNRRVIGEGGVSAENSTVNVLDNGAINAAFDFARSSGNQAFALAGQAVSEAGAGQARVLDFGADALSGALGFGDAQNARVLDFGADALSGALGFGDAQNARVLDFGADALSGALGLGAAQNARVLDFGADALAGALQSADGARVQAFDFGADALAAAFQYGADANTQAKDAIGQTASLVKNAYEDAKGRGAMTDYILIGAILVMGLVAWGAIKK